MNFEPTNKRVQFVCSEPCFFMQSFCCITWLIPGRVHSRMERKTQHDGIMHYNDYEEWQEFQEDRRQSVCAQ